MHKEDIIQLLEKEHQKLFNWLENQPDEDWSKSLEN